jgi:flagellar assembly protein FliH
MASRIIPKERSSSYTHWEMDAFEQGRPSAPEPGDERERQPGSVGKGGGRGGTRHAYEQAERAHQQAEHDGYAAGLEAGRKAGYEAGYEAGRDEGYRAGYQVGYEAGCAAGNEHITAEAVKLQALLYAFQKELTVADQAIGNDLLLLALGLARQMMREALRIKPELVLAVVRECLRQEPVFGQPAQLFLHPEDAALVHQYLGQELDGWTICADLQLERGGCRI